MALAVHLRASFHRGRRKWPLHTLPLPHCHAPESLPVLSSTYCSQRHWYFVMWRALASLSLSLLSRLTNAVSFKNYSKRRSGQFGRRTDIKRMWHGGTLRPVYPRLWTLPGNTRVCVVRKMSRKEGQSGDSATKQSVTLCAVVHSFHSSSPLSISLSPPFPLSNWCPQSCVSPHLPALKLHQPYLLLSLSMIIIIIIIVIIVVIMVRIAVIMCYF